jgi:signal transduction histidine kinase
MRLFPKLLLSFLAIALIGVLVVAVLANWTATQEVRRFMFAGGAAPEQQIVQGLSGYYQGHGSWEGVQNLLQRSPGHGPRGLGMGPALMNQRVLLVDTHREVVADNANLIVGQAFTAAPGDTVIGVEVDGVRVGDLIILNGRTLNTTGRLENDLLARVNAGIWLAALVAGVVALVMASAIAYSLVRPIQQVTEAAGAIARGDLSQRVNITSRDEIGRLANTFNAMASDLEKGERLRRDLTADVAHELRNPLAVLQGNLEAVLDGVLPPTPENLQPLLDHTLLLARLVEDLRTLSLVEAGQLRLDRVTTDPAALMQSVVTQFSAQARVQQVTLATNLAPGLPSLDIDAQRMTQVLGNLLSNALRHTPEGQTITCRVSPEAGQVAFVVADTGAGIPPEILAHLFERFYRAGGARSHHAGSTGLGLAIAKQLVELHGGQINVASEVERGTTVTVTLPVGEQGAHFLPPGDKPPA